MTKGSRILSPTVIYRRGVSPQPSYLRIYSLLVFTLDVKFLCHVLFRRGLICLVLELNLLTLSYDNDCKVFLSNIL